MSLSITPLRKLAQSLNVDLVFNKSYMNNYSITIDFVRLINLDKNLPLWKKLATLAHELGHSIQSPKEFESYYGVEKGKHRAKFILAVEKDAWDKGEK